MLLCFKQLLHSTKTVETNKKCIYSCLFPWLITRTTSKKWFSTASPHSLLPGAWWFITPLSRGKTTFYFIHHVKKGRIVHDQRFHRPHWKRCIFKTIRSHKSPRSKPFSKVSVFMCVFDRFSVDDRRKHFQDVCVFQNALVVTECYCKIKPLEYTSTLTANTHNSQI